MKTSIAILALIFLTGCKGVSPYAGTRESFLKFSCPLFSCEANTGMAGEYKPTE